MTPAGIRLSPRLGALLAGAAAALAHPPFGLLPGLLGWGLLAGLWDRAEGERPIRDAFVLGWLAAFAYFLIGCWWVAEAFMVDAAHQGWMAPFAAALLPAGLGLFWGAAGAAYRWARPPPPFAKVLLFAGLMSAAEWARGHVLTGFPWNLPGETWRAGSAPSQGAALMGSYALSWLTLACAAAVAAPVVLDRRRQGWALCLAGVTAVAGLYAYGGWRLAQAAPPDPAAPWVRVVQADVPEKAKYNPARFSDILQRYLTLTRSPGPRRADIVIWPEGAIGASANDYLAPGSWTLPLIEDALAPGQTLMVGAYRTEDGAGGRTIYYNSLIAARREPAGLRVTGLYDKYRLVPFGEYLPLEGLMSRLGVKKLVNVGDGFTSGPPPRQISPQGAATVQPLICYEALYPGFTRAAALRSGRRARWIVNVSNDSWFGQTSGPWQHLNQAGYRAIEEGLPMVRATPTGVSAVIDAYGRSNARTRLVLGRAGVIDARLPPAAPATKYFLLGEKFFYFMLLSSVIGVVWARFTNTGRDGSSRPPLKT